MRVNLKTILAASMLLPAGLQAGVGIGIGLGLGPLSIGVSPSSSSSKQAPPSGKLTGLAPGAFVSGLAGYRFIDHADALPYFDLGSFYLPPDMESKQGWQFGGKAGYMWSKGVSVALGLEAGPRRQHKADLVQQTGIVRFEDYQVDLNVMTYYIEPGVQWLFPIKSLNRYLIFSLAGRLGLAELKGDVSITNNFPNGTIVPEKGTHKARASTFAQGFTAKASFLITPRLGLDLEAGWAKQVFTNIKIFEGTGALAGVSGVDTTGTGAPMVWNFSGPVLRAGLTWYFKTPVAALRPPEVVEQASRAEASRSEQQRRAGDALFKARLFNQALDSYRSALVLDANNARAWYGMGQAEYQLGNLPGALGAYEKVLEISGPKPRLKEFVDKLRRHLRKTQPHLFM